MSRAAFTLVELLVVIAIVAIIAAILLPVLARGIDAAKLTDDMSRMKQLGVARELYMEQSDNLPLIDTIPLVTSKLIDERLVVARRDQSLKGLSNHLNESGLQQNSSHPGVVTDYRRSFISAIDMSYDVTYFNKNLAEAKGAGWLVDLTDTKPANGMHIEGGTGKYRRLLLDGSVQKRTQVKFSLVDQGQPGIGVHPALFFCDEDYEWIKRNGL